MLKCSQLSLPRPDFAAAWMNLGIVQNSLRRYEEAEKSYWTAIRHRKKYPDCYYNLGRLVSVLIYLSANDPRSAFLNLSNFKLSGRQLPEFPTKQHLGVEVHTP